MSRVPCLRSDSPSGRIDPPAILSSTTQEQEQLTGWRDELLGEIDVVSLLAVEALAKLDATQHAGGLDTARRERLRELIVELLTDEMHFALSAIESDLERL